MRVTQMTHLSLVKLLAKRHIKALLLHKPGSRTTRTCKGRFVAPCVCQDPQKLCSTQRVGQMAMLFPMDKAERNTCSLQAAYRFAYRCACRVQTVPHSVVFTLDGRFARSDSHISRRTPPGMHFGLRLEERAYLRIIEDMASMNAHQQH